MDSIELGTQFDFSFAPGTTQEQILGFEMAGEIWSQYLTDDVTINIYVELTDQLPENVIGGALPGMKKDIKYEKVWEQMSSDITSIDDLTAFNNYFPGDVKLFELWEDALENTTTIDDLTGFSEYVSGDDKSFKVWEKILEDAPDQNNLTTFNDYFTNHEKLLDLWEEMAGGTTRGKKFSASINGSNLNELDKMKLTNANSKALDLLDGDKDDLDGYILMSNLSGQNSARWDYNSQRQSDIDMTTNTLDFLSVALHEVGHVLGFVSGLDDGDWLNVVTEAREKNEIVKHDAMKFSTPLDIFRYSAAGTRNLSIGEEAFFSIDGGNTNLGYFSTGEYSGLGGDGYQASHWKHNGDDPMGIMDPVLKLNQRRNLSNLDLTAVDVMGWNVNSSAVLNWQQLYDNAVSDAQNAWIEDRTKDVEKMVQQSQTYHGRRGRRSGSWQIGLWQHIKFQTLDVEVQSNFVQSESDVAEILIDNYFNSLSELDRDLTTNNESNQENNKNTVDNQPEVEEIIAQLMENSDIIISESTTLDLDLLGRLISEQLEDVLNIGDELLVMPIN